MAEFIELTKTSIGVGENSIKQKCLVNVGKISHIDPTDGTWEKAYDMNTRITFCSSVGLSSEILVSESYEQIKQMISHRSIPERICDWFKGIINHLRK